MFVDVIHLHACPFFCCEGSEGMYLSSNYYDMNRFKLLLLLHHYVISVIREEVMKVFLLKVIHAFSLPSS